MFSMEPDDGPLVLAPPDIPEPPPIRVTRQPVPRVLVQAVPKLVVQQPADYEGRDDKRPVLDKQRKYFVEKHCG